MVNERPSSRPSRRSFLRTVALAFASAGLAACRATAIQPTAPSVPAERPSAADQPAVEALDPILVPTPACDDGDPTPPQTAGPFYTPNSPQRSALREPGIAGLPLTITGYVLDTQCRPLPGVLLDFWHCDADGQYDNVGYRLRGHLFSDAQGRYVLETIQPGLYPGRTRHVHVRVQAPNRPVLTTQLYFPGEPLNARDWLYHPACLMDIQRLTDGSLVGRFNFVLAV